MASGWSRGVEVGRRLLKVAGWGWGVMRDPETRAFAEDCKEKAFSGLSGLTGLPFTNASAKPPKAKVPSQLAEALSEGEGEGEASGDVAAEAQPTRPIASISSYLQRSADRKTAAAAEAERKAASAAAVASRMAASRGKGKKRAAEAMAAQCEAAAAAQVALIKKESAAKARQTAEAAQRPGGSGMGLPPGHGPVIVFRLPSNMKAALPLRSSVPPVTGVFGRSVLSKGAFCEGQGSGYLAPPNSPAEELENIPPLEMLANMAGQKLSEMQKERQTASWVAEQQRFSDHNAYASPGRPPALVSQLSPALGNVTPSPPPPALMVVEEEQEAAEEEFSKDPAPGKQGKSAKRQILGELQTSDPPAKKRVVKFTQGLFDNRSFKARQGMVTEDDIFDCYEVMVLGSRTKARRGAELVLTTKSGVGGGTMSRTLVEYVGKCGLDGEDEEATVFKRILEQEETDQAWTLTRKHHTIEQMSYCLGAFHIFRYRSRAQTEFYSATFQSLIKRLTTGRVTLMDTEGRETLEALEAFRQQFSTTIVAFRIENAVLFGMNSASIRYNAGGSLLAFLNIIHMNIEELQMYNLKDTLLAGLDPNTVFQIINQFRVEKSKLKISLSADNLPLTSDRVWVEILAGKLVETQVLGSLSLYGINFSNYDMANNYVRNVFALEDTWTPVFKVFNVCQETGERLVRALMQTTMLLGVTFQKKNGKKKHDARESAFNGSNKITFAFKKQIRNKRLIVELEAASYAFKAKQTV